MLAAAVERLQGMYPGHRVVIATERDPGGAFFREGTRASREQRRCFCCGARLEPTAGDEAELPPGWGVVRPIGEPQEGDDWHFECGDCERNEHLELRAWWIEQ